MTSSHNDFRAEPLSDAECARLRPSVDVVALQRWLDATLDDVRVAVIAHFATMITFNDLQEIGKVVGAAAEDLALWEEPAEDSMPLGPLQIPGPDAPPNAVAFRSSASWQPIVWIEPPEDPILAALWNAIEPSDKPGRQAL